MGRSQGCKDLIKSKTTHFLFKVGVLYPRFDDVQGCCDGDGGYRTCDGCDEVLGPGGFVVVGNAENVVLCYSRCTEELGGRELDGVL